MRILPMPEIYFGDAALNELAPLLNRLSAQKIMVITDGNLVKAGVFARAQKILNDAGKEIILFDDVQPDPSIELVKQISSFARTEDIDAIIGLGGGSSIDSAKIAGALSANPGDINEYMGVDLFKKDSLPVIAIPTTAGTGSEVTPIAILTDEAEHLKKGIVSNKIIPRCAILDPALTIGAPPGITASTGMDALTHAIEAYTSVNANDYTDSLALKAVRLISQNILDSYSNGNNLIAREQMLMGSLLAGMAFANAGVAAVHAFAYPLGGTYHIAHGLSNSVMLPTIMQYNMIGCENKYADLAKVMTSEDVYIKPKPEAAVRFVQKLSQDLNIPQSLKALDIPRDAIPDLAESAMKVTRLLANNPRRIEINDAMDIYTRAYGE